MEYKEGERFRNKRTGETGVLGPILADNQTRCWSHYQHPAEYTLPAHLDYVAENYESVKEATND